VFWYQNASIDWDLARVAQTCSVPASVAEDMDGLLNAVLTAIGANQNSDKAVHIVVMSNGGFDGFHRLLIEQLASMSTAE
jgi:UDP-N-acetylmuramate: L-alanyl-gamma-D-glutamyl-meso-diaminopimelate ligase